MRSIYISPDFIIDSIYNFKDLSDNKKEYLLSLADAQVLKHRLLELNNKKVLKVFFNKPHGIRIEFKKFYKSLRHGVYIILDNTYYKEPAIVICNKTIGIK